MKQPLRNHLELLTDTIFFIGNGSSRKNFDLNLLRGKGTVIGCNALYRDFKPDILVCQDSKMGRELFDNKYSGLVLSGKGIGVKNLKTIHWAAGNTRNSGTFGLKFISSVMKPSTCYVLGLDGYPGNIYENTLNYVTAPRKIHQFAEQYKNVLGSMKVVNVNIRDTWGIENNDNYSFISYKEFKAGL